MKKRVIALVLAVVSVMLCLSLAACGDKEETKKDALIVGFDAEFPPMGFQKDGEYVGFDLDLAKEVANRLGMDFQKKAINWGAKDAELKQGSVNVLWNGFTIQGRENDYEWTTPYMKNRQVAVVLKGADINSLADLKGKKVVVQVDSAAKDALNDNAELKASVKEIIEVDDYLTALNDLKTGGVDVVLMDETVAGYNIEQQQKENGDSDYKIIDEALSEEEYGVGFLKGNTELRDKVQKTLEEMAKDGTLAKISNEWFGKDVTTIGK